MQVLPLCLRVYDRHRYWSTQNGNISNEGKTHFLNTKHYSNRASQDLYVIRKGPYPERDVVSAEHARWESPSTRASIYALRSTSHQAAFLKVQ